MDRLASRFISSVTKLFGQNNEDLKTESLEDFGSRYWKIFYDSKHGGDSYDEDLLNYHNILKTFIDKQNCNDDTNAEETETITIDEGYIKVAKWLKDQHDQQYDEVTPENYAIDRLPNVPDIEVPQEMIMACPEEEHIYAEVIVAEIHQPPANDLLYNVTLEDSNEKEDMTIVLENVIKDEHKIVIHVTNLNQT